MSKTPPVLRIAVADEERPMREFFHELLPQLGYEVVALADSGQRLLEYCRTEAPDLVITDLRRSDLDGIQTIIALNQEIQVPVILVTAHHDIDWLTQDGARHVMGYLTKPVRPVELQAAIVLASVRFEDLRRLRKETALLRQTLEDRKVIERAKGALMKWLRINEEEALRRLRISSCDQGRKLVNVAQTLLSADEVFRSLEGI
jgi:response regulator NasT